MKSNLEREEIVVIPGSPAARRSLQLVEHHVQTEAHGQCAVHLIDLPRLAQGGLYDIPVFIVVLHIMLEHFCTSFCGHYVVHYQLAIGGKEVTTFVKLLYAVFVMLRIVVRDKDIGLDKFIEECLEYSK